MADEVSNTESVEVESHRGREASNVLSYRKFVNAVKAGTILPGMERVPEVLDGNRIVTHSGYKAVTFDVGTDNIILREVDTVGRSQRPHIVSEAEFTPAQVFKALQPKTRKTQPATE